MREMIIEFLFTFKEYFIEVLPWVIIGFFLSGLIHEFVPTEWVEKHLGKKGIKPLLYTTLVGTALPICCWGSLPVAFSLYQKGAKLGPVLAFLVATPATSISALLVCFALLGIKFTVFIFFAVVLMGLVVGTIGNLLRWEPKREVEAMMMGTDPVCGMRVDRHNAVRTEYKGNTYYFCCPHCQTTFEKEPAKYVTEEEKEEEKKSTKERMSSVFRYAFIEMVREMGPELILGLALAALVAAVTPVGKFVGDYLSGGLGYLFSLIFGLIMYICSTASVPLVHAFISQGMNHGAGMVLLLVGPITSWGTILVLRKEFGIKIILVYLAVVSILALFSGFLFSII